MGLYFKKIVFFISIILFFQSCASKNSIKSIAQSSSASQIEEYKDAILNDLISYKRKLDLRNPNSYNKNLASKIYHQIDTKQNYINIAQNGKKLNSYKQYLYYAFSKEKIKNRNDFLILGIYKLIFNSYGLENPHQFVALEYNKELLLNLYRYLQIIKWKVKSKKDNQGCYLYKTWQNNWQLELLHKDKSNLNIIRELEYIKSKKETIFDHSNFSFEILISNMIYNVKLTLKKINVEPFDMGASALKSFVFIL